MKIITAEIAFRISVLSMAAY